MVKYGEIKTGDYFMADYEGQKMWGEVVNLNGDEKQVCIATDVQEFWFDTEHLYPIVISDESLRNLNFIREDMPDGSVKYKKKVFRMLIAKPDDFTHMDCWYRDDKRYNPNIHYIHELQNMYLQMTKIHLTDQP